MVGKLIPGVTGNPFGASPSPVKYPKVYPFALGDTGCPSTSILVVSTVIPLLSTV